MSMRFQLWRSSTATGKKSTKVIEVIIMPVWNDWCKQEYTIKEIQASLDIAFVEGEMGWPSIQDVLDRMVKNRMDSIGRSQLSESERDCVEKAMYHIHSTGVSEERSTTPPNVVDALIRHKLGGKRR